MADGVVMYTDGSCFQGSVVDSTGKELRRTTRGYGGYAAIVEHGHDGWVVRGHAADTTSTAMELEAVLAGLHSVPNHLPVRVYTDCTLVLHVHDQWRRKALPSPRNAAMWGRLQWLELGALFDVRAPVAIHLVRRRDRNDPALRLHALAHQRAHAFAQHEARLLRQGVAEGDPVWVRPPYVWRQQGWHWDGLPVVRAGMRRS